MLSVALGLLMTAPDPSALLEKVDLQESVNDELELYFDSLCGALKAGAFVLGEDRVLNGAQPPTGALVWIQSCSLRALKLGPSKSGRRAVRLLWEMDGRDVEGGRVTERGEADGEVQRTAKGWRLTQFKDATRSTVKRPARRFVEVAAEAGLVVPERKVTHAEKLAGGLTARDFDGDGRDDLVMIDGPRAHLFLNRGGLKFERVLLQELEAGLFTAAVAGDFDADGDADVLLTVYGTQPSLLLRNDAGKLSAAGTVGEAGRVHSGLASDLDDDGKLDVALIYYALTDTLPDNMLEATNGEAPRVFRGDGRLGFSEWKLSGMSPRWSLAAESADVLGEGRPQLYVANDFGSNDLYRFLSDGGVENAAARLGLDDPGNGMSADVEDLDGDGRLDVYVANMFSKAGTRVLAGANAPAKVKARLDKFAQGNTLYLARADGGFSEVGLKKNVNRGLWAFGSLMFDYDDDGRLDVAVANGFYSHPRRKDL